MIRYKEKEFQQWSICPATGDIFDMETGEIQPVKFYNGDRPCFKRMPIHRIMAHTFFGWKPGYDVHHLDENKLNNTLLNLVYLSKSEHARLHNTGKKRESLSDETKAKISAAMKGKTAWNKGKPRSAETRTKIANGMRRYRAENILPKLN